MIISKGKLVASDTPDHLEELMAGNETVELTVKATREKTEEILRNISYIQKSEVKKAEQNTVHVILQAETGKDIRENVFFAFAERKTPILRMETRKVSLEDVFLELTQGEAQELEGKSEAKLYEKEASQRNGKLSKKGNQREAAQSEAESQEVNSKTSARNEKESRSDNDFHKTTWKEKLREIRSNKGGEER